jgi:hypothetical protein
MGRQGRMLFRTGLIRGLVTLVFTPNFGNRVGAAEKVRRALQFWWAV